MRFFAPCLAVALAACVAVAAAQLNGGRPANPLIELQSGPLTPGLMLDEVPWPVHQLRLVVDATLDSGVLILDGNDPEFNEFGELVGGVQAPHVRAPGDAALILERECAIELIKQSPDKWRLYRVDGPGIETELRVATRGTIADGGPARLVVLGPDGKPKTVVACIRYGLAVP